MLHFKNIKLFERIALKKTKTLFLAYVLINGMFIAIIVICLLVLFNQRNLLDRCGRDISTELIQISGFKTQTFQLAGTFRFSDNFYSETGIENNAPLLEQVIISKNKILELKQENIVHDIHYLELINALATDYENLEKENRLLMEYLVEIGNENFGTYSKLINSANEFEKKFLNIKNSFGNSNPAWNILSSIALLNSIREQSIILNTQTAINQLLNQFSTLNADSSDYSIMRVSDALENLNSVFQEYARKAFEIGLSKDKGLLQKLDDRYTKIEFRLQETLQIVYKEKTSYNIKAIIILLITLLLIIVFNFIALYFFIKRERKLKRNFEEFIDHMNLGRAYSFKKEGIAIEFHDMIEKFENFILKFSQASKSLTSLSKGNLEIEIDKSKQLEGFYSPILSMKQTLEKLNLQINDEKRIQSEMIWIKKGIDRLTEVMRREYDNPLLHANEIINMLVDYLKIPIGAIYLSKVENDILYLEMASAFAYGNEKQVYKKIIIGEGIVGTAASEQKTINITNIPENYFNIISGFGETKPRNIVASPIKLNEEIFGVIELATLSRFKEEEISFIEEVCKTIAYSFAISKVYLDTLNLFEQSNLQIAQLQTENESLTNDYEDLSNNYKNHLAKAQDNEFLVARLNDLAIRLTLDLDGNILEANSRFEQLFRADRKKLIQSNFRDYMAGATFKQEFDFEFFWRDIRAGIQHEIELGIMIAGQEFWLRQHLFPVKDELGRVKKVQVIAFEITDLEKLPIQSEE